MKPTISVVTPTYNERDGIERFIETIAKRLNGLGQEFEIVIVDDNSPDGTADVVAALKPKYPNITLVKRVGKLGIGSAYFDGFSVAHGDYLIGMDADLSPGVESIPLLVEELASGAGMVVGSRYLPQSQIRNMTRFKSGGSKAFNFVARRILGIPLTDITHSNRAFTKEAFGNIAPRIQTKDHPSFFIECSFWAHKEGYKISEIPITFTERTVGHSKLNIGDGLRNALITIFRLSRI